MHFFTCMETQRGPFTQKVLLFKWWAAYIVYKRRAHRKELLLSWPFSNSYMWKWWEYIIWFSVEVQGHPETIIIPMDLLIARAACASSLIGGDNTDLERSPDHMINSIRSCDMEYVSGGWWIKQNGLITHLNVLQEFYPQPELLLFEPNVIKEDMWAVWCLILSWAWSFLVTCTGFSQLS